MDESQNIAFWADLSGMGGEMILLKIREPLSMHRVPSLTSVGSLPEPCLLGKGVGYKSSK